VIDIHHHCLPGVDDGPRDLAEAVDLCRMAEEDGIETIVATPHVLRGRWQNDSPAALRQVCDELRSALGASPRLLLGSEYFFAHDMTELLATADCPIVPLAASRYVLVEFAAHAVPPLVEQPFYRAQLEGWTPIIAHPERNIVFQAKPELLESLIRVGAKTQVTAGSLVGEFGRDAERCATAWLRRGMVHVVASDAHNRAKRPPRMTAAAARVRELAGDDVADALFDRNPAAVVNGRALEYDPEPLPPASRGFFASLSKLWK
jgi:protein-tyrosine phosphatase